MTFLTVFDTYRYLQYQKNFLLYSEILESKMVFRYYGIRKIFSVHRIFSPMEDLTIGAAACLSRVKDIALAK